jgi:predicted alpha/beta-hydrolase family hydrolase
VTTLDVETPHGPARVELHPAESARAALVLGHGAGGGIAAPDLVTATRVAGSLAMTVALVEQPYRVAGKRSSPPTHQLDTAWTAVLDHLRGGDLRGLPLVAGGRSAGARVACRTAPATGAVAVLCLAFPLQPPRRASGTEPPSRLLELEAVRVPVLVVQGEGDQFGMPPGGRRRKVVQVPGNHSLRTNQSAIAEAIRPWLARVLA